MKNERYAIPAIVFGGGMNALAVVRNLGRNGISVYCVTHRNDVVKYSVFCRKQYVLSGVEENETSLRSFLRQMRKQMNKSAVLFSANDSYSLRLSSLKEEFEGDLYIPLPSYEVVKILVNKKLFYQSLMKHRVSHPKTYFPESPEDVKRISGEIDYPVFVKPCVSHIFARKFPNSKGFVANSKENLMKYYVLARKCEIDVVLQEVVPGLAAGNVFGIEEYFDKSHSARASFAYCRVRGWPPTFGNTSLRKSIPVSDITEPYVTSNRYLQTLAYHGLMEAEWKRDPNNRTFKLLEINPRQSMQSSLPARCGMNLVLMAYLDTIGEAVRYPRSYAHEVGWVDFLGDFRSVLDTNTPIDDWLRSLRNVREWSFFAIDDLRPWIMSNAIAMKKIAQRCLGLAPRFRAGYPVTRAAFSHGSASPRGFPVAAR